MKSFKQLREDCGCEEKERKGKKKSTVEIMPKIRDNQKDMVRPVTNQSFSDNKE